MRARNSPFANGFSNLTITVGHLSVTNVHQQPALHFLQRSAFPQFLSPLGLRPSQFYPLIAFIATPARPNGWIAWAINPTSTGMAGSQALIAFKDSKGAMTVKMCGMRVKESSAEFSNELMRIFDTIVLSDKGKSTVNHVWQVGPSVTSRVPDKHEFQSANLNSKGSLDLLKEQSTTSTNGSSRT
ncbi:Cytochrome [Forsythia ovata]|uniref:Cytochrome n=1 Tax=Forsythia ovata TaxID=205694 RepID=A0ABD1T9V7_9LAMI